MNKFKSGQKAPESGDYRIVNSRGQIVRSGVSVDKGESSRRRPAPTSILKKSNASTPFSPAG